MTAITHRPVEVSKSHPCIYFQCRFEFCLLYTSDAADDLLCVDLGGRRIIKKKKKHNTTTSNPPTQKHTHHMTNSQPLIALQ